jgi:hypothetical protein
MTCRWVFLHHTGGAQGGQGGEHQKGQRSSGAGSHLGIGVWCPSFRRRSSVRPQRTIISMHGLPIGNSAPLARSSRKGDPQPPHASRLSQCGKPVRHIVVVVYHQWYLFGFSFETRHWIPPICRLRLRKFSWSNMRNFLPSGPSRMIQLFERSCAISLASSSSSSI